MSSSSAAKTKSTHNPVTNNSNRFPRIPFTLRDHWRGIIINWSLILVTSFLLPLIGYFTLHYLTSLKLTIVFSICTPLAAVVSLFSLGRRTWALFRRDSICRPLSSTNSTSTASRWALDDFNWNFAIGFTLVTVILVVALTHQPIANVRLASLGITVLLLQVCSQLALLPILIALNVKAPFRLSSIARGEQLRPACFIIAEDIIAVDGGAGTEFRRQWNSRYNASPEFRTLMLRLDLLWGWSGLALCAAILGIVYGVSEDNVGYAVGWAAPWVWAAVMALVTTAMTKSMLRREASEGAVV